jgi:hypothetical protein
MKLRHFVCGSSALLAGWLALTFVVHVPVQRYQKPDAAAAASLSEHKTTTLAAATATQSADLPVSVSR